MTDSRCGDLATLTTETVARRILHVRFETVIRWGDEGWLAYTLDDKGHRRYTQAAVDQLARTLSELLTSRQAARFVGISEERLYSRVYNERIIQPSPIMTQPALYDMSSVIYLRKVEQQWRNSLSTAQVAAQTNRSSDSVLSWVKQGLLVPLPLPFKEPRFSDEAVAQMQQILLLAHEQHLTLAEAAARIRPASSMSSSEVMKLCRFSRNTLTRRIQAGLITPLDPAAPQWQFSRVAVLQLAKAERARRTQRARQRTAQKKPDYLTATQAANQLGIQPQTLRLWGNAGVIPYETTPGGGCRRYRPADVEALQRAMDGFKTSEVAAKFGVNISTIPRWTARGHLHPRPIVFKVKTELRYDRDEVNQLLHLRDHGLTPAVIAFRTRSTVADVLAAIASGMLEATATPFADKWRATEAAVTAYEQLLRARGLAA